MVMAAIVVAVVLAVLVLGAVVVRAASRLRAQQARRAVLREELRSAVAGLHAPPGTGRDRDDDGL